MTEESTNFYFYTAIHYYYDADAGRNVESFHGVFATLEGAQRAMEDLDLDGDGLDDEPPVPLWVFETRGAFSDHEVCVWHLQEAGYGGYRDAGNGIVIESVEVGP